jgi:hypothetical protein
MIECVVFFKSRISVDDFANCLIQDHEAIFGRTRLDHICNQFDLNIADAASYIHAFYEFQAFGLHSISDGVRQQCHQNLRTRILTSLNRRFATVSGPNWEMMRLRVTEYEEFGSRAPIGSLAAQLIFDSPTGAIQPDSKQAFDLTHAMNASYLDALKAVARLFKHYKFDA